MTPWTALIVDDEALARSNLQLALEAHPGWACAGSCHNTVAARVALQQQAVDLILLDIKMPGQNGLAWAAELCTLPQPPLVVFVTAYDQHALSAFDVYALDYLLKPFDGARFASMLKRAEEVLTLKQTAACASAMGAYFAERQALEAGQPAPPLRSLTVRSIGVVERIEVADIEWVGGAGNYVRLQLPQRVVLHRATLAGMEERLPPAEFLRVHRTALVRRSAVAALKASGPGSFSLQLKSGAEVPVSDRHLEAVRALFG